MRRLFCIATAMMCLSAVSQAGPIRYDFDLTITEKHVGEGSPALPSDPFYDQFYLGQKLPGSFLFDYERSLALTPWDPLDNGRYLSAITYWVDMGSALMYGEPAGSGPISPLQLENSAPGNGQDRVIVFDEIPHYIGTMGAANGYIEQFYFSQTDPSGTLIDSLDAASIDWTALNGARWNFWWAGEGSGYSSMLLYGTIDNIRPNSVPEPGTLGLLGLGVFAAVLSHRRRRWLAE